MNKYFMELALFQPEIPHNTGAIIRMCACFSKTIHLIEPFGFSMEDKYLKRSGMDYIDIASVKKYKSFESFVSENNEKRIIIADVNGKKQYTDFKYSKNDIIVMGRESDGFPEEIILKSNESIKITQKQSRSLNLAIASAIVFSEALRQTGHFHGK